MKNTEIKDLVDSTTTRISGQMDQQLRAAEIGSTVIKLLAEIALRLNDKDSAIEELESYRRKGETVTQTSEEVEPITLPEGLTITEDVLNKAKDNTTKKGAKK